MWKNSIIDLFTYDWINIETFCVALFGVWFAYGVIAWWLSGRPWGWFVKFALTTLVVSPMLLIGAYELLQILWVFSLTVVFGRGLVGYVVKWRAGRGSIKQESQADRNSSPLPTNGFKLQWSMKALLCAVTALAVSIFVCMIAPGEEEVASIAYWVRCGIAAGCVLLGSTAIGKHASRIWLVLAMVIAAVGQWLAFRLIFQPPTFSNLFAAIEGTSFIWGELEDFEMGVLLTIAFCFMLFGFICRWIEDQRSSTQIFGRIGKVVIGAIVLLQFVLIGDLLCKVSGTESVQLNRLQTEANLTLDQAVLLENMELKLWRFYPPDETQQVVSAVADPLERVEQILEGVKLSDREISFIQQPDIDLWSCFDSDGQYREIARALSFRAKWSRSHGEHDAALEDGILAMKLPMVFVDQRTLVTRLIAVAIEGIGAFEAAPNISEASDLAITQALADLLKLAASEVDAEVDYQNDWAIWWHSLDWFGRLNNLCGEAEHRVRFQRNILPVVWRCQVTRRQLIVMLALELYQREYNELPVELEALTPEFLPYVPLDPFNKSDGPATLKYQRNGEGYLLYSLGMDGEDNSGVNHEFGYGYPGQSDLNFPAAVEQSLIEEQQDRKAALEENDDFWSEDDDVEESDMEDD